MAIAGDIIEIQGGEQFKVLIVIGTELICFNEASRSNNDLVNVQVVDDSKANVVT